MQIGNDGTMGLGSGPVVATGGIGILSINSASDLIIDNALTGNLALIKGGVGTLTLTGDNTYTWDTQIEGGTLLINDDCTSPLGRGSVVMSTGTVLCFDRDDNLELANLIWGDGNIVKTGAGTVILKESVSADGRHGVRGNAPC